MNRLMMCLVAMLALGGLLGSGVGSAPAVAAPVVPQDVGVYEEDFSTYVYKDYTQNAEWDIWAQALRLAHMGVVDQFNPAVTLDDGGNAFVVWTQRRNDGGDIYAQKLDLRGNRLWVADVRVNSDSETADCGYPAVAVDGHGRAIVVWQDRQKEGVYAQKLDGSGSRLWATDMRVNPDNETASSWLLPAVAVDESGNAIVVWTDARTGNRDIYAQRLDGSGNRLWVADVRVNSDSGTADQYGSTVAVDRSGNAIVVWEDKRNVCYDIYAQKLDGNGNRLWGADMRVNSDNKMTSHYAPVVAEDRNGSAVVVWDDMRNGYDDSDVYGQKLDGSGSKLWAADVRVNSDSGTAFQQSPALEVDGDGNAIVVWRDDRNGDRDIYAQGLDGSGNRLWTADVRVNSDSGAVHQGYPAVAVDVGGNAIIVWEDDRNDDPDIYAEKTDGGGTRLWSYDVRVNCDNGVARQQYPTVTLDGNGDALLVWGDDRNGNGDIYARGLDGSGNRLWAAGVRVNSDSGRAHQERPAVAVDASDSAVVVWTDARNSYINADIYAQKLGKSGNRLWTADVRVNSDSGAVHQEYPAVAVDENGNAVVAWATVRHTWVPELVDVSIYAQKLDGSGNTLWISDMGVSNWPASFDVSVGVAVAVDPSGNTIVVWNCADIYAQKLDRDGNRLWATDVQVNSDSGAAYREYPGMAVDASGNAFIVWADARGSERNIYAQKLDGGGNRLWFYDVRVNSDSGAAGPYGPAVAVEGNGNAVVVWEDERNITYDVYAQKLDGSGNRLWSYDVRVNSDSGTASQYSPSVAVDRGGNAVVVWEDYRNNNADIYIQKINSVGQKVWPADLQVVYPDLFYLPAGIVQSRSVDTRASNIAQANLTANYQTSGGGVQFYLTNDGGAHWSPVTPGVNRIFSTIGSDLRWRAVFIADPVWQRTPVVNSLRIEYSTQAPPADDYEPDDTCVQASPLQVNGAAQAHTFHQYADGDWTWFEAVAGTTYAVQAVHTGSSADLELGIYGACGQPSLPPDDEDTFGNDAYLVFTAPTAGVYYIKSLNHDLAVYGEDTGYLLSVRTQSPAPVVAIVAGRNERDELEPNITYMGDQAYRTFRRAGVPRENIRYLSIGVNRDTDQDGHLDVDGQPTWENVRYAVQDWPRERGVRLGVPFYLYLVDHGGTDYYCAQGCAADRRVTAADLNLWLDNLEATSGADEINVVIEACFSGSFIDMTVYGPAEVSDLGRVVIASTGSRARAFPSERGGYFSDAFFTALGDNADLWTAYEAGRAAAQAAWSEQTPWLDDNGDTVADGRDGLIAQGRGLASLGGGSVPVVDWLGVGPISASGTATIMAQVRDDVAVVTVTVEVYPPGLTVPETGEGETPVLPVERVDLQDRDGDGVYEGDYTDFTEEGVYRLVAYAWDNDGNLSLPRQATVGERRVFLPLVMRGN